MKRITLLRTCLILLCACSCIDSVLADQEQQEQRRQWRKMAFTDVSQVDASLHLQGEYTGAIVHGGDNVGSHMVGLQVVALGDGQFSAAQYLGGLPGEGWTGETVTKLNGNMIEDDLVIRGAGQTVVVRNGQATLMTEAGKTLGTLAKVNRVSPRRGAEPPKNASVLFDGTNTDRLRNGRMTDKRNLKFGTELKDTFRDFKMHIEFKLPYMPYARGQGRANSGVYLQSRYEVQILDSFGLDGKFNECGALYRYRKPDVNMCYPPLSWQTYDIDFRSPRFDRCGRKLCHARLTVRHNGTLIHDDFIVRRKTGAGKEESSELLPIKLQDHGNPVVFQNIWIVEHKASYITSRSKRIWPLSRFRRFRQFRR